MGDFLAAFSRARGHDVRVHPSSSATDEALASFRLGFTLAEDNDGVAPSPDSAIEARDYSAFRARGVRFVWPPAVDPYGKVVVFEDLYGNLWHLVQFAG